MRLCCCQVANHCLLCALQNHPGKGVTAHLPEFSSSNGCISKSSKPVSHSSQHKPNSSSPGLTVVIGNRLLMQEQGVLLLPQVEEFMQLREGLGQTCVLVGINGTAVAAMAVSDPLKPEAAGVVAALQQQVSGDQVAGHT